MSFFLLWSVEILLIALSFKMVEESFMVTKKFLEAAFTRAIRTVAQAMVAAIGTTTVMGGVDWKMVFSTAALSGILSLLTSLSGLPEVDEDE